MSKSKTGAFDATAAKVSRGIILRFLGMVALYVVAVFAMYYAAYWLATRRIWQGDELFYRLTRKIVDFQELTLLAACAAGFLVLLAYYWRKTLGYLGTVLAATQDIYEEKDDLIQLPPDLQAVEMQMNQIKLGVRTAKERAREAEQRKNDLVVYLAHDLKTPLTSVIGYLSLMRDEREISDELRRRYLSVALDKAERLEDLINEFFEITRFNLTHIELEVGRVNLSRMLEQIAYEFRPMLAEHNLTCELSVPQDLMVQMDADKMQRVFDNLFRNAVSYSFHGAAIAIDVSVQDEYATVRIANSGNTIPPEKLERIFERFYRLDSARASNTGGAGLGLSIAKQIVELHGGTLTAASADERTAFTVTLPL